MANLIFQKMHLLSLFHASVSAGPALRGVFSPGENLSIIGSVNALGPLQELCLPMKCKLFQDWLTSSPSGVPRAGLCMT